MKRTTTTGLALIAGVSLAISPILGASATGNTPIINGDFELDSVRSTTITGWTALNEPIDLGVTPIAGCITVDTSDYTQLRDYPDDAEDASVRQDNVSGIDNFWDDEPVFATTVVDLAEVLRYDEAADEDLPFGNRTGQGLELYSDLESNQDGYVVHGPAVFSEPFSVSGARQISFDWAALDESDDFKVFGYLLNVDTCEQSELIDATGLVQEWTTTSVDIAAAGTYRFVFVAGSFDQSFGGAAGAYLYVDNIVQRPAFSGPGISLALSAEVGDYFPGSSIEIAGSGLLGDSDYQLVLRSNPVLLGAGQVDAQGSFYEIVTLPGLITPGAHTITLTGVAPNGEQLVEVVYITVGEDGTLLYLSTEGPQATPEPAPEPEAEVTEDPAPELAETGANTGGIAVVAALFMFMGAIALVVVRRRVRLA